jgi:N,N'-diacetyllegionaminate synthase
MSTLEDIRCCMDIFESAGCSRENITLLHVNTQYPTPFEDVNLRAMPAIGKEFGVDFGYSDHTLGIEIPIAAAALGAKVIEKHFTLDKSMKGPDHAASLEPHELKAMVEAVRNIEKALGDGIKRVTASESTNLMAARKSIVAARDIRKGEIFDNDNLAAKRPGTGISPMRWKDVVGRKAVKDYKKDEQITFE